MKSLHYRNLIVIAFVSIFMNSRSVQFGVYLPVIEINKCSKYMCVHYILIPRFEIILIPILHSKLRRTSLFKNLRYEKSIHNTHLVKIIRNKTKHSPSNCKTLQGENYEKTTSEKHIYYGIFFNRNTSKRSAN